LRTRKSAIVSYSGVLPTGRRAPRLPGSFDFPSPGNGLGHLITCKPFEPEVSNRIDVRHDRIASPHRRRRMHDANAVSFSNGVRRILFAFEHVPLKRRHMVKNRPHHQLRQSIRIPERMVAFFSSNNPTQGQAMPTEKCPSVASLDMSGPVLARTTGRQFMHSDHPLLSVSSTLPF